VVVVSKATRRAALVSIFIVCIFLVCCATLEITFKQLPVRLLAPLNLCLGVAAIMSVGALRRVASPVVSVWGASIVIAVAIHQAEIAFAQMATDVRQAQEVERDVRRVAALEPSLLVLHLDAFPSEYWWRPFQRPALAFDAIRLGGNNRNPQLQQFLSNTGRQPLLRAVCHDPSILVVAHPERLFPATIYMQEHQSTAVSWTQVYAGTFRAWRCAPRAAIASTAATPGGLSTPARLSRRALIQD
jgi:hypothetical protein